MCAQSIVLYSDAFLSWGAGIEHLYEIKPLPERWSWLLPVPQLASTEKGKAGREGIACPELFSPGACPCADIFLPKAKAVGEGDTRKEGFSLLLLIRPLGNARNLRGLLPWLGGWCQRGKTKNKILPCCMPAELCDVSIACYGDVTAL